ncbi:uncharacterized protein ARMOST_06008 [Armillaria ostoyae]|uniref:Uncharacterized protein n=1 Tax=Armillaria ostoyae TaxID=47428 RepID=A0A284R1T4_ARMOS|nr:uncharacterized protein ARMOST_06008 [Armillaria ostoyae]
MKTLVPRAHALVLTSTYALVYCLTVLLPRQLFYSFTELCCPRYGGASWEFTPSEIHNTFSCIAFGK